MWGIFITVQILVRHRQTDKCYVSRHKTGAAMQE